MPVTAWPARQPSAANPNRGVWIAGAIGAGALAGVAIWFLLRHDQPEAEPLGKVICPTTPFSGVVRKGDYIVVQLGTLDGKWWESTWAKATSRAGPQVTATIVGEIGEFGEPKPLQSLRHGFALGDTITVPRTCIVDRFRPGQHWNTICGPSLFLSGYAPMDPDQASLLGVGDRARLVARSSSGKTGSFWVTIDGVAVGQQSLHGQVDVGVADDLGPVAGDIIEFLRDCVIEAKFEGGLVGFGG